MLPLGQNGVELWDNQRCQKKKHTWYWCHFRGEGERRKEVRVVRRQEGRKEGASPEGKGPKFGWS